MNEKDAPKDDTNKAIAEGIYCTSAGEYAMAAGVYCIAIGDYSKAVGEFQVDVKDKITFPNTITRDSAIDIIKNVSDLKKTYAEIKTPFYFAAKATVALDYLIQKLRDQYNI
jgi:hypothetical protein